MDVLLFMPVMLPSIYFSQILSNSYNKEASTLYTCYDAGLNKSFSQLLKFLSKEIQPERNVHFECNLA